MLLLICGCASLLSLFAAGFAMFFLGLNSDIVAPPKRPSTSVDVPVKKKDCAVPPIVARINNSLLAGSWLAYGDPADPKHFGWLHPVSVALVHYFLMFVTILPVHDGLVEYYNFHKNDDAAKTGGAGWLLSASPCKVEAKLQTLRDATALFLGAYAAFIVVWRVFFRHEPGHKSGPVWYMLYDYCWLCNVSLWMGGWALHTGRPILAQALCVAVGIDQLSWYVDLIGYGLTRKWPIGVAKYLTWPEYANWPSYITCTHHLWTIPLLLGLSGSGTLHVLAYPLSMVCCINSVLASRWLTPASLERPKTEPKYLNVNLSHLMWKDLAFKCLQINNDDPPGYIYVARVLFWWNTGNTTTYIILYAMLWAVAGGEARIC